MASFYQRGKFYWIKFRDQHGKLIQKNLKHFNNGVPVTTEKWAKFVTNKVENEILTGASPVVVSTSPGKAKQKYFEHCEKRLNKSTVDIYKVYINKFFDKVNPQNLNIKESTVTEYLNNRDISNRTANHTIKILKQFLNFCVRQGFIQNNPIKNMKTFRVEIKPPRFLSKEEARIILEYAKQTDLYPMIATAIYTGMRLGELKRLQWSDIDLKRKQITVRIAKSKRFRVLPIHPDLLPILKPLEASGSVFDCTSLRGRFDLLKKDVKLADIGWHTFRHTFASHLVMDGIDIVTVSKLLGHSSITVTMIYASLAEDHIKESVSKLHF